MRTRHRIGAAAWALAVVLQLAAGWAVAQEPAPEADEPPPPPPVIQRLVEVAKDPERLRELVSDPDRVAGVMEALDNDAVREFMSDPWRVAAVARQVDLQQVREVIQTVDRAKVREALAARWKLRLKERLGAGDEEWKVLEPLILKVVRARREARIDPPRTAGGVRGVRAVPPPVPGDGPSEVDEAESALREVAGDPDARGSDVARPLAEYRQARDAARKRLAEAEAELRELLTQRQEGVLVVAGILR